MREQSDREHGYSTSPGSVREVDCPPPWRSLYKYQYRYNKANLWRKLLVGSVHVLLNSDL